ncbi:MAG: hypothetical protein WAO08_10055 [Hyphomicrobiaceae bacterium]
MPLGAKSCTAAGKKQRVLRQLTASLDPAPVIFGPHFGSRVKSAAFSNHHGRGNMGRQGSTRGGHSRRNVMPKMSDSRRKRIQAKQRKATNALQRATKLAKRQRNSAKAGKAAP